MKKEIILNGQTIEYELEYKKVKNINLRVINGKVYVSANKWVGQGFIEAFMHSEARRILNAISKEKEPLKEHFTQAALEEYILNFCQTAYPYYKNMGVKEPQVRFKKMVSRWGSCNYVKGILTFNTNLMYAPKECVEYVIWHEFTHFLVPDHSKRFYEEVEKVCPDWKACRAKLKNINIRR